ncbi:TPA: hypothetical protein ACFNMH_001894 [Neisseria elongata]
MHKIIGYRELHTENGEPVEITMYLPFFSDEYKAYICQYKISKYCKAAAAFARIGGSFCTAAA